MVSSKVLAARETAAMFATKRGTAATGRGHLWPRFARGLKPCFGHILTEREGNSWKYGIKMTTREKVMTTYKINPETSDDASSSIESTCITICEEFAFNLTGTLSMTLMLSVNAWGGLAASLSRRLQLSRHSQSVSSRGRSHRSSGVGPPICSAGFFLVSQGQDTTEKSNPECYYDQCSCLCSCLFARKKTRHKCCYRC